MRIAVVSNGPSAHATYGAAHCGRAAPYDRVICVNKAALRWECDWWAFTDWWHWADVEPVRAEKLFVRRATLDMIRRHCNDAMISRMQAAMWDGRVLVHEHVRNPCLPDGCSPWNCKTGTAAIVLALQLRATEIDVYGADMTGESDCDGEVGKTGRGPDRWRQEWEIWRGLEAVCVRDGVALRRVLP